MNTRKSIAKSGRLKRKLRQPILASVLALSLLTTTAWAEFSAEVNTQSVAVNDVFELTLTTNNSQGLPDLAPLEKDFQIISMSQSRLTNIVNGRTSYQYSWVITLSPKVVGQLTVPMLRLGNEVTSPITLNAVQAGQVAIKNDESIRITAEVADGNHYVFQEIPLTVRIETTQSISQAELITDDVPDLDVRQNGEDKTTQVMRNGRRVIVLERQYILSPQKTGRIEIPPITVRGNLLIPRNRGGRSGFDDLFDEQIREHLNRMGQTGSQFDSLFSTVGPEFVAKTDPIILDIQANPNGSDAWFLPAKAVTLTGAWQPQNPTFKAGQAVTRKIELLALGAQPEQLPTLDIPDVDGLQIYTDNDTTEKVTTDKGVMAKRTIMLSIIPERGGTFTLPELSIDWQNTLNDTAQKALLPSETFNVEGSAVAGNSNAAPATNTEAPYTEVPEIEGLDIEAPSSESTNPSVEDNQTTELGLWWKILIGLLSLLILAILGWIVLKKLKRSKQAGETRFNNSHTLASEDRFQYDSHHTDQQVNKVSDVTQQLNEALNSENVEQIYQALLTYRQVKGHTLREQGLQEADSLLQQLEGALYGTKHLPDFDKIVLTVKNILASGSRTDNGNNQQRAVLPKLYPQ